MAAEESATRSSYNKMSHVYGWLSDESEKEFARTAIAELLCPADGDTILEPGFGSGQILVSLAKAVGDTGHVSGIDISDGMVAQATKRLTKHQLTDRVTLTRGDARHLPYPDNSFSGVFLSFTLELFSDADIPVVVRELARVLQPDGRLVVAAMSSLGPDNTMEKLYRWSHEKFPHFVDCRPIDAPNWLTPTFEVVETKRLDMWGLAVDLVKCTLPVQEPS